MKLTSHSYNNSTFESLLDGLSGDIVLKKHASKPQEEKFSGMNIFSSNTQSDLDTIHEDDLRFMAAELQFAADLSKVAITAEDLAKFAKKANIDGLRGKKLERAARKYCNELQREIAVPQGTTRTAENLIDQLNAHTVTPAGYNPEFGPGEGRSGGYLGQSKNPNSIWDSGELSKMAEKPHSREEMYGDEQIKQSKTANEEYKQGQKDGEWQARQDKLSDSTLLHKKIASTYTGNEQGTHQVLPINGMSMFNNHRNFENIPDKTVGEMLKETSAQRSGKSEEAKNEWNYVKPSKKVTTRSSVDKIFETLL